MTASVLVEEVATGIAKAMATNTQLHTHYVGLEAIDGFLAAQLCQSLDSQCGGHSDNPNDKQSGVLQHLIMALSKALRNGHSCLPLADIAGQTYWSSAVDETRTGITAEPGIETSQGYTFASFEVLMESLQRYPITADDGAPLVLENARLYLRRYWQYEQQVAQHLLQRMQVHPLTEQQHITADA
jgi:exodeoxyribonuclease V alpha subunit